MILADDTHSSAYHGHIRFDEQGTLHLEGTVAPSELIAALEQELGRFIARVNTFSRSSAKHIVVPTVGWAGAFELWRNVLTLANAVRVACWPLTLPGRLSQVRGTIEPADLTPSRDDRPLVDAVELIINAILPGDGTGPWVSQIPRQVMERLSAVALELPGHRLAQKRKESLARAPSSSVGRFRAYIEWYTTVAPTDSAGALNEFKTLWRSLQQNFDGLQAAIDAIADCKHTRVGVKCAACMGPANLERIVAIENCIAQDVFRLSVLGKRLVPALTIADELASKLGESLEAALFTLGGWYCELPIHTGAAIGDGAVVKWRREALVCIEGVQRSTGVEGLAEALGISIPATSEPECEVPPPMNTREAPAENRDLNESPGDTAWFTVPDAAKVLRVKYETLKKRVQRWRDGNPGSRDFIEHEGELGGRTILYRFRIVRELATDLPRETEQEEQSVPPLRPQKKK